MTAQQKNETSLLALFVLLFLTTLISSTSYYLKTLYLFDFSFNEDLQLFWYLLRELLFWSAFVLLTTLTKSKKMIMLGFALSVFPGLVLLFNSADHNLLNIVVGIKITFLTWCIISPNNNLNLNFNGDYFYKFVKFLLYLGLAFQIVHLFFGYGYHGKQLGLNLRNPNFFVSTSVSAYFIIVCYSYLVASKRNSLFNSGLILFSLFLTNSTLGSILSIIVFLDIFRTNRRQFKLAAISYAAFILTAHVIRQMCANNYLELTAGTRNQLFKEAIGEEGTGFFTNFGNYSSFAAKYHAGVEPDSLVVSIFGNLGSGYALFFLFTILLVFLFKSIEVNNLKTYLYDFSLRNSKIVLALSLVVPITFSLVLNLPEINFVYALHFLTITLIFNALKFRTTQN